MSKILILWEDEHHQMLDRCLRRALQRLGAPWLELFPVGVRGNGGFEPFVSRDWPKAVQKGLPKSNGPIEFLVCIADADRAHQCCAIEAPPTAPAPTTEWVERANTRWTEVLRSKASLAPERIHGRFLRWNQESLLIAAHDIEAAMKRLGCHDMARITAFLRSCSPDPLASPDALFVEQYRKAGKCLEDMLKAAGVSPSRKGTPPRRDALDEASRLAMEKLCARVPDLAALAALIRDLAEGAASRTES